ncbi:MAG: hypothetical protein EOP11_26705 [Proteobacteria bacterium]|nr:MAG: hypothetical protein EOP11_26705 [Pseudomonadota bacterium]
MTPSRGLATALFLGAALSSAAHGAPRGTRSMRCRDVRSQVSRTGRYYAETADGLVPFYDLFPVDKFVPCAIHQRLYYVQVPTLDAPKCHVGYTCIAN